MVFLKVWPVDVMWFTDHFYQHTSY